MLLRPGAGVCVICALLLAAGCSNGQENSSAPQAQGASRTETAPSLGVEGGKTKGTVFHGTRPSARGDYPAAMDIHGLATAVTQSPVSGATNDLTMEARVWWNGPRRGDDQFVFYNGNSGADGYGLYLEQSRGYKLTVLAGGVGYMRSQATLPAGNWSHVAIVRSGGTWTLYVNGAAQALDQSTLNPYQPSGGTGLGSNASRGQVCDCVLDEVRVWNYARSAGQIGVLKDKSLRGDEHDLAAYWPLDEGYDGQGQPSRTAGDASKHGFNAAIQGDVVWWVAYLYGQNPEEWLTNIKVLINVYSCPPGYARNTQDLNEGAGGDDVYACITYGPRSTAANALGVVISGSSDAQCQYSGTTRVEGDLNSGAGGKFINFCLGRNKGTIKSIGFDVWKTAPVFSNPCDWNPGYSRQGAYWQPGWGWVQGDLNKGVRFSKYIYTCVYLDGYGGCSVVSDEETVCAATAPPGATQRTRKRRTS